MENKPSNTRSTIFLTLIMIVTIVLSVYVHYDAILPHKHIDSTYYTKWHPPIELKILKPGTYPLDPEKYTIDNRH